MTLGPILERIYFRIGVLVLRRKLKRSRFLFKGFSLWWVILLAVAVALIISVFLFFLPRISAQNEQDYSLVSCPLQNGAQPGSVYFRSANLKYQSVSAEPYRDKYPQGSLYRYYIEREDGLKFYLILNFSISSEAESASSKERRLNIKGDTSLFQGVRLEKYSLGFLKLEFLGSSGEKLTVLDFGQLGSGDIYPQQYNLPSRIEEPRFIAEYSYSDSGIYGGPSFKCKLEDLIHLD